MVNKRSPKHASACGKEWKGLGGHLEIAEFLEDGLVLDDRPVLGHVGARDRNELDIDAEGGDQARQRGEVRNARLDEVLLASEGRKQPVADFERQHVGARRLLGHPAPILFALPELHAPASTWGSAGAAQAKTC